MSNQNETGSTADTQASRMAEAREAQRQQHEAQVRVTALIQAVQLNMPGPDDIVLAARKFTDFILNG